MIFYMSVRFLFQFVCVVKIREMETDLNLEIAI